MSNVLVYIGHVNGQPKTASLTGITFGKKYIEKSGGELHLAVIGKDVGSVAEAVSAYGAAKVHVVDHPSFENYLAESYAPALEACRKAANATLVAGVATSTTKDLFPRLAAKLDAGMASDVLEVVSANQFKRPMWAGNVIATVELTTDTKVATVRGTEFEAPAAGTKSELNRVDFNLDLGNLKSKFVSLKEVKSERPDVTTAEVVVAGGRGVKGADGFKVIEELADALGAGVGASRAVCDAGWVPNDLQIGQTGKVVAPNLYFAIGISGAIQHLAGMKGSKVIVAINKDPEAPIFQVADYGLVDDLFKAVPALIEAVKK